MGQLLRKYRVDRARIVSEQFEEETVLVNVDSGYYYSLSPSGVEILELLNKGLPADNLAPVLFGDSENCERFRSRIAGFVDRLAAEGIIVEDGQESGPRSYVGLRPYPAETAYELPVLERFDDVRDLLLIDPIHQVDPNCGWPKKKSSESHLDTRA